MFKVLSSVSPSAITASRRGAEAEAFYADLVGTIAFKFARNVGAKNLLESTLAAAYVPGMGGLKADLIGTLQEILKASPSRLQARDTSLPHAERERLARAFAEEAVRAFKARRIHRGVT